MGFGLRQLIFLGATFVQTCTINSTFAIVAPFFPLYAQEVGIEGTQVAAVFGAFAVAQLAMAPFAGGFASGFGRKRVLTVGVCCVSLSTIAMGMAAGIFAGDPAGMVTAMIALRVVQGGGAALATTCIFAILTDAFPQNKGAVIGAANACDGAGWAIGPPVGGFLYVAGGFSLPFFVVGPLPLALLLLQLAVFPRLATPSPRAAAAKSAAADDGSGSGSGEASSMYGSGSSGVSEAEAEPERIGAAEVWQRARGLICAPMCMTMAAGAVFTSKWGMFDVTFTPWAVSEFGFSIREVSIYFSIPAMAFLFISPFGGMVVDKVDRKKRLIGAGFALISIAMLSQGPWVLSLSWSARHRLLIPYLIAEGVLSPLIMPAMLPDMLDTTRPRNVAAADYVVDEHTTNIVTSFFTTSFNLGGIFGPLLGAYLIPVLGTSIHNVAETFGLATVLATAAAAAAGDNADANGDGGGDDDAAAPPPVMSVAELENAFGFRCLLSLLACVFLTISGLFVLFECCAKAKSARYVPVKTSDYDNDDGDDDSGGGDRQGEGAAAKP